MASNALTVEVFQAADFVATAGVALGEPLSFADELVMDDIYQLADGAVVAPLALETIDNTLRRAIPPHNTIHPGLLPDINGP